MLRSRGSGRGTVALVPDFPRNRDHSDPPQGPPRTGDEVPCHTPPRDVPKLGTFPSLSILKGNTTHGRRLMQFISSVFSNWKIYLSFSKINSDITATLCALLSIYFKTLKSHKVDSKGRKKIFFFLLKCINNIGPSLLQQRPSQQHSALRIRSTLFFQSCQFSVAWPQVSYFRFPNIMRSLKN